VRNSRYERIERLKAVEREFHVVRAALEQLQVAVTDGRVVLPGLTSARDLDAARRQIEATFLIRLWAEFETAVLSYYRSLKNNPDLHIRAINLIDAVFASRRRQALADAVRVAVHEVREYRNSLVHDRDDPAPPVAISEARRCLNVYLGGKLPEQWA
jgi:hypothetical protein